MENEPFLGSQTGPQHQLQPIIEDHDFSFKIAPALSDPTLLIFQEPQQHHVQKDPQSSSSSSSSTTQFGAPSARTKKPGTLHRCKTAPAMAVMRDLKPKTTQIPKPQSESSSIIRQAVFLLLIYLSLGVVIYSFNRDKFSGIETHPVVDALYFCIVTMCTIGYGDIAPTTTFTKIFACVFVLFGFGFIDILLSGVVNFVLDLQENMILTGIQMGQAQAQAHSHRFSARDYIVDVAKGRMRIRLKVGLALGVVVLSIGMGALVLCFVENLNWIDSIYLSVMSVTTVGYGDRAFKTVQGRLFAAVWLLFSTLAVARAFMYLAEARVDKRHRRIIKWVLDRDITVQDLLAANINDHGFISKSEYVIHKLKEMGKIGEKDILQICNQFSKLDQNHSGKITLPDVTGRAERRWRGGSETLISPLEAHPCGPGSNPIESQSAFFHFRTFLTLTTPREVHLQVLSSTGQRVTIPCDNTITPHPATNPRRPYIKRCIRHVNCIDHVACLTHGSLVSKSRHSDPTHHRFTHTSVGHSFSVHDSPHPQAIHASSLTCMSPKPWRHIYSECPT